MIPYKQTDTRRRRILILELKNLAIRDVSDEAQELDQTIK